MTYDQCQALLDEIRRRQGTDRPLIRVVAGSFVVRGRVARGQRGRRNPQSPFGLLVVEQPGLTPGPASLVQIASIPEDGLSGIETPERLSRERSRRTESELRMDPTSEV